MRISDWSSDVCSSDLPRLAQGGVLNFPQFLRAWLEVSECPLWTGAIAFRSELLMEAGLFPGGRAVRGGDKDLWMRAMSHTRLVYGPVITEGFNSDSLNNVSTSTTTQSPPSLVDKDRNQLDGHRRPKADKRRG